MGILDQYIEVCERLSQEYWELAKKHNNSVWGQAFYTGVANTFLQVAYSLSTGRTPEPTVKEKLLSAIFGSPDNYLNANVASEQYYGSWEKELEFEANQKRKALNQAREWLTKNNKEFNQEGIEDYIQWEYFDTSEEAENDD